MEVDFFDIFPRLTEIIEKFRTAEWSVWEIISTAFAILGAIGTVLGTYIKWRNSGIRRAQRLKEFLEEREARVSAARWDLRDITKRPTASIDQEPVQIIFNKGALGKKTKKQGWVWLFGRDTAVEKAIARRKDGLAVATRAAETTQHELFLAHLTRGAIHDSRREHENALHHFREALKLKPDDLQALECAGLQLCLVGAAETAISNLDAVTLTANADDASRGSYAPDRWRDVRSGDNPDVSPAEIKYLTRMLALSGEKGDDLNRARAHRSIAFAYERLAQPHLLNAVRHARLAVNTYPEGHAPVEEVAQSWEQLGCLVFNRSKRHKDMATEALREARSKYRAVKPPRRAAQHVSRIDALIKRINAAPVPPGPDPAGPNETKFLTHLLAPLQRRKDPPSSEPARTK